jgi:PhnB protein
VPTSRLNPYLAFDGDARAAMDFYADVFGGRLAVDTYDSGDNAGRVMHAVLETDVGYTIMAGDVAAAQRYEPMAGCSVSLSGDDEERLRGYWARLSAGGTVLMALEKQVWGDEFGMCVDRFGVSWMVNISRS